MSQANLLKIQKSNKEKATTVAFLVFENNDFEEKTELQMADSLAKMQD